MKRLLAVCVALGTLLPFPSSASAQTLVSRAARGLKHAWIYVDPPARATVSRADELRLNAQVRARHGAAFNIVVARESANTDSPDEIAALLHAIRASIGKHGTLAVVVGDHLVADSDAFPRGYAAAIAGQSERVHGAQGAAPLLYDFISRLGADVLPAQDEPYFEETDETQQTRFVVIVLGVGGIAVAVSIATETPITRRRRTVASGERR